MVLTLFFFVAHVLRMKLDLETYFFPLHFRKSSEGLTFFALKSIDCALATSRR